MLLTITCAGPHAQDFGFLLHKHPDSVFARELAFGTLTVFYPENEPERATVALVCDVNPVALVRGGRGAAGLDQYVNDRPYVASGLTSVALREAFASALAGRSKNRPDLVETPLTLRARVSAVHARGGPEEIEMLFRPLKYEITVIPSASDSGTATWGDTNILSFEIAGTQTVHDLLSHLYVLLPVLDAGMHYFVGAAEVEKLLEHGTGWLAPLPAKDLITTRYLKHRRDLVRDALSQLTVEQEGADDAAQEDEDVLEATSRLGEQRIAAVVAALKDADPPLRRIVDMGCGEGKLLGALLADGTFTEIVGVDVSPSALAIAEKRLGLERMPEGERDRIKLLQGSLLYRDRRLEGYHALALVEVIEHIDPERLETVRAVVFDHLRPRRVVLTTPNAEYHTRFVALASGQRRHTDHRFEWTRAQFRAWCEGAIPHGYAVHFADIGPADPDAGAPTQMAIFDRETGA